MKPWSERTRKDKTARILASIYVIVTLVVGTPVVVGETIDYAIGAPCRAGISDAITAFRAAKTDSEDVRVIAAYWAAEGKKFRDALAAVMCIGDVAAARDAMLPKLDAWIGFMEAAAATGEYSSSIYYTVSSEASEVLDKLKAAVGFEG